MYSGSYNSQVTIYLQSYKFAYCCFESIRFRVVHNSIEYTSKNNGYSKKRYGFQPQQLQH